MDKDNLKNQKNFEKKSNEANDAFNRAAFGTPTIGGFIVMGVIIAFVLYMFFK
ncbi:hypothetical protein [Cytobacillus firmus]|uniref:hypothetical protein n=1 Tax=Cytobacillus firmus TaxID=1399 RepID=UPI0024C1DDD9|nr:hypothetical protein [Cytobacillus firmus]WHY59898.1 hypothetical protein QNH42_15040 [Cytobacillus firmus]